MASFVPDPIEKWAVCAASPMSSTLPSRHDRARTVTNLIQRLLLATRSRPSSTSANISAQRAMPFSSLSPGFHERSEESIWPLLIQLSSWRSEEHTSELQPRLHLVC